MEWKPTDCPYFGYEPCEGEIKIVDSGEGYIVTACEKHADLVTEGIYPWSKPKTPEEARE